MSYRESATRGFKGIYYPLFLERKKNRSCDDPRTDSDTGCAAIKKHSCKSLLCTGRVAEQY
jgi:hypothetical protein